MKRGHVANLILQEIEDFQEYVKRKELREEIKEYLRTVDHENLIKEDILNGVYMPQSAASRELQAFKDDYSSTRPNLQKNTSRSKLGKSGDDTKKPYSVRASSKGAVREKKLPPTTSNKEKSVIPSQMNSVTNANNNSKDNKENKSIQ
jgi:hypothetical protein